ncbi:MAG: DUF4270 family protein [Saprospiraceae bacterium]
MLPTKLRDLFRQRIAVIVIIIGILLQTCNKSSNLGSDLLSDEWINASGLDTFSLSMEPYVQDSLVYASAGFPNTFFAGSVKDPYFGTLESEIYTQLYFAITNETDFLTRPIDSVVLSLRYDSTSYFGQPDAVNGIHVHTLTDTLYLSKTYYKNEVIHHYDPNELGSVKNFIPNLRDSVKFNINSVEYTYAPQLRIPLDTAKFMGILRAFDDSVFTSLTYFTNAFPGIAIHSDATQALLAIALTNTDSRITIYYNPTDTTKGTFEFNLGLMRISTNRNNNAGSRAEQFELGTNLSDSLSYIGGFGGVDTRIKIPYHKSWDSLLVNYAVLELVSPEQPTDPSSIYKRPPVLNLKEVSSGKPASIVDALYASSFNNTSDFIRYFGGAPIQSVINGETVYKYRFNITGYFTEMKKQKKDLDIIATSLAKTQSPNRLVVGGPKHERYPAKLILVLSQ